MSKTYYNAVISSSFLAKTIPKQQILDTLFPLKPSVDYLHSFSSFLANTIRLPSLLFIIPGKHYHKTTDTGYINSSKNMRGLPSILYHNGEI
jgi:hypothetical protein